MLAAIAGERGETGKRGDLLVVERAELGHFDEHGDRGGVADAGVGDAAPRSRQLADWLTGYGFIMFGIRWIVWMTLGWFLDQPNF